MATERTLGARILDAAMRWSFERALNGADASRESCDTLHALAARADAAERLAKAAAWYVAVDESPLPDHGMSKATAAEYEMDQAADAYRARKAQGVPR